MKVTITLILALFSGALFSQKTNVHLIVMSSGGEKFSLFLNGVKQNARLEASVKVNYLKSASFDAQILFEDSLPEVKDKIYTIWEGKETDNREFNYVLEKKGDKYRLRFLSSVELKLNEAAADSSNKAIAQSDKCKTPRSTKEFEEALEKINEKSFEDSRLDACKELLQEQCMSTNQLQQICEFFEYDDTRLKLLKYAYDYCTDKNFYKSLLVVFSYKNSKREFSEFLAEKGL